MAKLIKYLTAAVRRATLDLFDRHDAKHLTGSVSSVLMARESDLI